MNKTKIPAYRRKKEKRLLKGFCISLYPETEVIFYKLNRLYSKRVLVGPNQPGVISQPEVMVFYVQGLFFFKLRLNACHQLPDIGEVLNLALFKLNTKLKFDCDHQVDMRKGIPFIHIVCG